MGGRKAVIFMCGPMSICPSMEFMTCALASLSASLSLSLSLSLSPSFSELMGGSFICMWDMSWPDMPGMFVPDEDSGAGAGGPFDRLLDVCPQATLHRMLHARAVTKFTSRLCIAKSPILRILALSQDGCFYKKSWVTCDYRGNRKSRWGAEVVQKLRPHWRRCVVSDTPDSLTLESAIFL